MVGSNLKFMGLFQRDFFPDEIFQRDIANERVQYYTVLNEEAVETFHIVQKMEER
jgi:hypothetical protein